MCSARRSPGQGRRILFAVVLGAAAYFALFGGEHGAYRLWVLEREMTRQDENLEALREEVGRLRLRADSLQHDSATIERIARERFGLIRDGERLYRFVEGADEPTAGEPERE